MAYVIDPSLALVFVERRDFAKDRDQNERYRKLETIENGWIARVAIWWMFITSMTFTNFFMIK